MSNAKVNQSYSQLVSINPPILSPPTGLEICDFWTSAAVYEKLNLLLSFGGDKTFAVWESEGSGGGADRGDEILRDKMC